MLPGAAAAALDGAALGMARLGAEAGGLRATMLVHDGLKAALVAASPDVGGLRGALAADREPSEGVGTAAAGAGAGVSWAVNEAGDQWAWMPSRCADPVASAPVAAARSGVRGDTMEPPWHHNAGQGTE